MTGYHVFNIAIHVLTAVVLFDLIRRTLLQPVFEGRFEVREISEDGVIYRLHEARVLDPPRRSAEQ